MKKMLFIYNPNAGTGKLNPKLADVLDIFTKSGYEVTVYPTQKRYDAAEKIQESGSQYDLIVCSGGDGTLDEAVTGMQLCNCKVPLGYIPAGTTNDFATSLGIPKDILEAAETAVNGTVFPCDVGMFGEDYFAYIAAFGLFTDVSYATDQNVKNVLGHLAYILEGMKHLQNVKSYHMKVSYDDQVIEDDFIFGMITNSYSVGGFKNITGRNVALNDGLFEVTLIKRPNNPIELNSILTALISERVDTAYMYCFKTASLTIESGEEIAWTLDGEYGGNHTKVELSNKQQAVDIIVKE